MRAYDIRRLKAYVSVKGFDRVLHQQITISQLQSNVNVDKAYLQKLIVPYVKAYEPQITVILEKQAITNG